MQASLKSHDVYFVLLLLEPWKCLYFSMLDEYINAKYGIKKRLGFWTSHWRKLIRHNPKQIVVLSIKDIFEFYSCENNLLFINIKTFKYKYFKVSINIFFGFRLFWQFSLLEWLCLKLIFWLNRQWSVSSSTFYSKFCK